MPISLRDEILAAAGAGLDVHGLVDPSLLDGSARALASRPSSGLGHRVASVIPAGVGLNDQNALSVLPYLLNLSAPTLRLSLLQRTIDWTLESHAVTWIASTVEQAALADMLALRMNAELSPEYPVLLRYADARVLPVVHRVLSEAQRASFFSPVAHWWYFDREEVLRHLSIAPAAQAAQWPTSWQLSDEQEDALLQAAAPDAVLAILRRLAPLEIDRMPRNRRHAFVAGQLARAQRWNISAENQQALFCLVALDLGDGFDERGDWPHALTQVKLGKWEMSDAIASVPPAAPTE